VVIESLSTVVGVLGLVVGALVGVYEWWGMPRLRQRVLVNFCDPQAPVIDGILWQRTGPWLVLRDCTLLTWQRVSHEALPGPGPRSEPLKQVRTRVDGELTVDRAKVLFLQVSYEPPRRG
jgi:hypothetical protein